VGKFAGTGLTLTVDPADNLHATFTGSGTLDNYFAGGTSNLRTVTMNGNLYIQSDGNIKMFWTAVDPLGGTVGGCSSTAGMSCNTTTAPPAAIVGNWNMSQYADGSPASVNLVLLADSRFMLLSTLTGGCQAMESGTYTYDSVTAALTLSVTYDTSTTCGLLQNNTTATVTTPVVINRTFTTAGALSSTTGGVTGSFTKLAQTTTEVGTWLMAPDVGNDFALMINVTGGKFLMAIAPSTVFPNVAGKGLEYGTYTASSTSYTATTIAFDGNGTNGISGGVGVPFALVTTDVNHITINGTAMVRQ